MLIEDLGQFQIEGCVLGMNLFADVDAENSNRDQQFQHRRKDSQEQHSFRNVFSKKIFCISFSFSSLLIQDIESFNKSISTSSLIQSLPSISPTIS